MVNPSKANALSKRASSAVKDLVRLSDYLQTELAKQSPLERPTGRSKYSEALYPETIELKRKDIELLADSLRHIRRELDKFLHFQAELHAPKAMRFVRADEGRLRAGCP
jgi:hypothetical protein